MKMTRQQPIWKSRIQRYRLLISAFALSSLTSFSVQAYQLVDLGVGVTPKDLNNNLTVVGSRTTTAGSDTAFRWTSAAGIEDLAVGTTANAVNDSEQIVGNSLTGAFLIDAASTQQWDGFDAYGINDFGGISGDQTQTNPYRPSPLPVAPAVYDGTSWTVYDIANVYSRGTRDGVYADMYRLQDINNNGLAIGNWGRSGLTGSSPILIDTNAPVTSTADVTYLPTPNGGEAAAINNLNMVVGTTGTNLTTQEYAYAYLYDGTSVQNLGTLQGGLTSSASDINDAGEVVGSSWLATSYTTIQDPTQYRAFIWDANSGMQDLNGLVNAPGWLLTTATAINASGDIVGTGIVNGELHGFLLATEQATPPPAVNEAPVVVASSDVWRGRAPLMVNFSATGSYDPDGSIVSYDWDFGDGSVASGENVSHTYTSRGIYIAVLTVTDDQGLTGTAQIEIRVFRPR
jgi:probable HAF family extracellular repeat protein